MYARKGCILAEQTLKNLKSYRKTVRVGRPDLGLFTMAVLNFIVKEEYIL